MDKEEYYSEVTLYLKGVEKARHSYKDSERITNLMKYKVGYIQGCTEAGLHPILRDDLVIMVLPKDSKYDLRIVTFKKHDS